MCPKKKLLTDGMICLAYIAVNHEREVWSNNLIVDTYNLWYGSTYFFRQSSVMITDVVKEKEGEKRKTAANNSRKTKILLLP